ncbi:hypothetical protein Tchl_1568 [Thauera chlorobenzoica]|uniref:Uncharacterized protein n=1 Tax=Thauera chlorobenzoica TaxID=96773 RepID=A0A1L6FBX9_9RHOO|nr:hypothetical protein Tchl_1568 [Thauera chlorobenzoica]
MPALPPARQQQHGAPRYARGSPAAPHCPPAARPGSPRPCADSPGTSRSPDSGGRRRYREKGFPSLRSPWGATATSGSAGYRVRHYERGRKGSRARAISAGRAARTHRRGDRGIRR